MRKLVIYHWSLNLAHYCRGAKAKIITLFRQHLFFSPVAVLNFVKLVWGISGKLYGEIWKNMIWNKCPIIFDIFLCHLWLYFFMNYLAWYICFFIWKECVYYVYACMVCKIWLVYHPRICMHGICQYFELKFGIILKNSAKLKYQLINILAWHNFAVTPQWQPKKSKYILGENKRFTPTLYLRLFTFIEDSNWNYGNWFPIYWNSKFRFEVEVHSSFDILSLKHKLSLSRYNSQLR